MEETDPIFQFISSSRKQYQSLNDDSKISKIIENINYLILRHELYLESDSNVKKTVEKMEETKEIKIGGRTIEEYGGEGNSLQNLTSKKIRNIRKLFNEECETLQTLFSEYRTKYQYDPFEKNIDELESKFYENIKFKKTFQLVENIQFDKIDEKFNKMKNGDDHGILSLRFLIDDLIELENNTITQEILRIENLIVGGSCLDKLLCLSRKEVEGEGLEEPLIKKDGKRRRRSLKRSKKKSKSKKKSRRRYI